jgi:NTE family protein
MAADPVIRPDVLVLGAGGTLGEAWMRGVLNGLLAGEALDLETCDAFVGTSAGSIVASVLASGQAPDAGEDRAARAWSADAQPENEDDDGPGLGAILGRLGLAAAAPFAGLAAAAIAPGGALLRRAALAAAPRPDRHLHQLGALIERSGARFDGRLRICTVDRATGRRVVFGAPGAPRATVRDAVLASCAIPWVFAPVEIGGREYVDGGVWSPTNLDAAPARRGTEVLCLVPTAALGEPSTLSPAPWGALRRILGASLAAERAILAGRGARVRIVVPDADSATAMGNELMSRRRVGTVLDAGVAQGVALARRRDGAARRRQRPA